MGTGVGLITDAGRLGTYVNEYGILGAPYLVDNYEEALKLLETTVYDGMIEDLAPTACVFFRETGMQVRASCL